MIEVERTGPTDLQIVHNASHSIGAAVIVINSVEQALDAALAHYFQLHSAAFSFLPMLDFRSKMLVIARDKLLSDIIDRNLRSRLHKLYDKRNILAHGYVKLATTRQPLPSGEQFELRHPRQEATLSPKDVKELHVEAASLLEAVLDVVEEITDFVNPLLALREEDPNGTPAEFISRLRLQIDELASGSE